MPLIRPRTSTRRGDTIIEVSIAIVVFCLISVLAIGLMDRDLATIQGSLELTMARNEIDAQAEALRFIHNSYLSERELKSEERDFQDLWFALSRNASGGSNSGLANSPTNISNFEATQCRTYYDANLNDRHVQPHNIFTDHAFVLNTRNIDISNTANTIIKAADATQSYFHETSLYPRIIFSRTRGSSSEDNSDQMDETATYNQVARVEGVWVIASRDVTGVPDGADPDNYNYTPQFFDFHIRTCWYAPGNNTPTTIATIIRLYNPELVEAAR